MIHEYALDPELLKTWASSDRDYNEFFREYGLGTPRLASSFPKQKAAKYRNFYLREGPADEQSLQAQRYIEMVNHLTCALVHRDGFECASSEWSESVISEDAREPFYALLASAPLESDRCLTPATMYSRESIWNHPRQQNVARTYESCSPVLRDVLRLAKDRIVFVDSFGWNQRAIGFIGRLIGDAFQGRVHSAIPEIVLYYKKKRNGGTPSASHVKAEIERRVGGCAQALILRVYELEEIEGEDVFHNRCILTELGGVSLGNGVDVSERPSHTDELTLLEREVYEKKWKQFVEELCFEVVSQA
ncbi:hypothetical protein QKW35_03310 [Pontibacterium granulatum]|uniref:hypothetical protein n=1 Tax=Pontibacterium granulatum TaxID=2036029 RepID=UPI00249B3AAE|nr:hypothetical protein [Pontibacterium granulatum]MDI3323395.1 hypothetical protein [Pontibacterium granulatum]